MRRNTNQFSSGGKSMLWTISNDKSRNNNNTNSSSNENDDEFPFTSGFVHTNNGSAMTSTNIHGTNNDGGASSGFPPMLGSVEQPNNVAATAVSNVTIHESNHENNSSSPRRSRKDLPPLFWYMESGDWEKATDRVRRHPREVKTWATLKTKALDTDGTSSSSAIGTGAGKWTHDSHDAPPSPGGVAAASPSSSGLASGNHNNNDVGSSTPVTSTTKRLALHHACFKLRAAGSLPPPAPHAVRGRPAADPFVEICRFILLIIRLYPDAAARRESRHGCLPLHLAAFASCTPRSNDPVDQPNVNSGTSTHGSTATSSSSLTSFLGGSFDGDNSFFNNAFTKKAALVATHLSKPHSVTNRSESEGTTDTIQTNMSAIHAEEKYTGGMSEKQQQVLRNNNTGFPAGTIPVNHHGATQVSVSMRSNIVISAKREEMLVQVINALLDAYPKAARVDSEGGRLPLHTACAGRATPRIISTLITAYPAACRQRNKDGFLPLHLSAHWGVSHPAVAVQLLRAYPDATVGRNRWERTPLEEALCMAGENGRPHQAALVRALRKHPSYWTRPTLATAEFGFGLGRSSEFGTSQPSETSGSGRGGSNRSKNNMSTAVDIDESLPSNDSVSDHDDEALQMTRYYNQARHLMDEGIIDEEDEEDDENENDNDTFDDLVKQRHGHLGDDVGEEVTLQNPTSSSPSKLMQRLSPRGMRGNNGRNSTFSKKKNDPFDDVNNMTLATLIEKRKWKIATSRIVSDPLSAERELKVMTRGGFMASTGMSPLHYACERKPPVQIVRVLIEAFPFAVLTRAMPGGCLPLHIACTWGASPEVVQALLEADHGSVKVKDELGNVALHSACFAGADVRIVAMLLATDGKSVVARNHQGSRPIDICKRLRHDNRRDVISLLNRKKEELMRTHRRSRSSGLLADIAKEAEETNNREGTPSQQPLNAGNPFPVATFREEDMVLLEQQAVEVTYDEQDKNHELLWV